MGLLDPLQQKPTAQTAAQPAGHVTTIDVAMVTPASAALPEVPYKVAVEALLTKPPSEWPGETQRPIAQPANPVEACSRYHGQLVADVWFHPVVAAVHLAYNDHRPLVLSPDIIWLLVAQGFANHVHTNAEELRSRFVKHSGKVTITVRRDDFIKGSPENTWPEVFDEFIADSGRTSERRHAGHVCDSARAWPGKDVATLQYERRVKIRKFPVVSLANCDGIAHVWILRPNGISIRPR